TGAFALGVDFVENGFDDSVITPIGGAFEAQHTLGRILADNLGIRFGEPNHGQESVELDPVTDRITQRYGLATTGTPDHDPIRTVAANSGPSRRLLVTRRRVEERLQLEAFLVPHGLEYRDGFLAERRVDADQSNLLAFQVSAFLISDVFQDYRGLRPIKSTGRKYGRERLTICRIGAAVEHGEHVEPIL